MLDTRPIDTAHPPDTTPTAGTRLATLLHAHPRLRLYGLLSLPLAWMVGVYLMSLALLLMTAFWTTDPFTSKVIPGFTLRNFENILTTPPYLRTAARTVGVALLVTLVCAVLALPLGVFMAKVASPRWRSFLAMAITLPLWAGYLVKVFAMRISLGDTGPVNWLLSPYGLSGPGYGLPAVVLTLTYLWFPFMALPVYTALRQIPPNLFDAAADLGAGTWRTLRTVVLPLLMPAMIAGSLFTFSLSLGDFIAAQFVGAKVQMLGTVINQNVNLNPPLAAALSVVPILAVGLYLFAIRRTGALKEL
ncbi:ABC transporter permease [Nocardioides sp.]|uniref:ABC transporter permease n=1 Tax=Nocardioides sp. TaxID=35761 RepID=UPI0027354827|nr:ABC transporter permease [Nocardioides sp.]MDP3895018.1 ABC transporter permease [Nocardioides sp.]